MNLHVIKPSYLGQEADEPEHHELNVDAPIGLPGENAPEITLVGDEGREEKKRGAAHVFQEVIGNLRSALARKAKKAEGPIAAAEGLDIETTTAVGRGVVEGLSEEGERSEAAPEIDGEVKAGAKKKIDRNALLGGVAVVAIAAVAAGVAFWPSSPKKQVVVEQGMTQQPLLAPAATLATVPKPEIKPEPELPTKSSDPLKEILALKPLEEPAPPKDGALKPAEDKVTRVDDGAPKPVAGAEKPNAEAAVAMGDGTPGEPAEKAAAKPVPEDPRPRSVAEAGMVGGKQLVDARRAKVATVNEVAPSPQDRVEAMRVETALLERVTQLAALVGHLTDQVNRVERAQKEQSSGTQEGFADLKRRMALAESGHQLDEAAKAQESRNVQVATVTPLGSRVAAPVVLRTGPAQASIESAGEKRPYRVQAASPSLAMLGTGGNDAPLEITPGSTVPGWGRVTKIEQHGQTWVVVTTGGVIQ